MAQEQDEYKAVRTAAKIMAAISLTASLALAAAWAGQGLPRAYKLVLDFLF